jgi:hypothetical protein
MLADLSDPSVDLCSEAICSSVILFQSKGDRHVVNILRLMLAISKPCRSVDFKAIFAVDVLSCIMLLVLDR